jgi:dethiobiotin synthetase
MANTFCWFVSGTDTEVGKTLASCALLQAAQQAGLRSIGYKPVASGSDMTADGPRNSDALALQAHSSVALSYSQINRYSFVTPTSPHIVSEREQQPIELESLSQGLAQLQPLADCLVVEGAGGWFTPLNNTDTFADWVVAQQLPVILVVGMRLGCINHALLTAEAIRHRGLPLAGWIANDITPVGEFHQPYLETLQRMLGAPFLGEIPYLANGITGDLGQYLDLRALLAG